MGRGQTFVLVLLLLAAPRVAAASLESEVLRTLASVVAYELDAMRGRAASPRLGAEACAGEAFRGVVDRAARWDEMEARFEEAVRRGRRLGRREERILALAFERAWKYLDLGRRPLVETVLLGAAGPPVEEGWRRQGYAVEVARAATGAVDWMGCEEYARTRLGPLTALLDGLGPRDAVVFSNLPAHRLGALVGGRRPALRYHLPISSYGKDIVVASSGGGCRHLLLAGFGGRVYMRHFQLLVKEYLAGRRGEPSVITVEAPGAYEEGYRENARHLLDALGDLGRVEALVVGYARHFRKPWRRYARRGLAPAGSPWAAELYELNPGKVTAILDSRGPYHGEILGCTLRLAAERLPALRTVIVAGSGGSLHVRQPYAVVFPDFIELPGGGYRANALSSRSERLVHRTVLSPLVETRDFLARAMGDQVTTVDMEVGFTAQGLAGRPIHLGVAVLVTDFPVPRPLGASIGLSEPDASRKYAHVHRIPDAVEAHLREGRPVLEHPLERALGTSLRELSRRNIALERQELGPLDPREARIFEKVARLDFRYSFRLTPWRLLRILEDEAILSTAQVAALKKVPVAPFTPGVEEKLYGAYAYTFGSIGFWTGSEEYGEVVVRIRPTAWRRRSWATRHSGWWAIKTWRERLGITGDYDHLEPAVEGPARQTFGRLAFLPEHYGEAIAIHVVENLRSKADDRVTSAFLRAEGDALIGLLMAHEFGYLEGKILGAMNLADVESVRIGPGVEADLRRKLVRKASALGVAVAEP